MMRLDLDGLADASREALMSEWRAVVGRPPAKHLSKPLMAQILSHTYQMDTVGGYTKRLDSRLKSAARRDVVRPAFKPGSRFMREYHGITHVVEVGDDVREAQLGATQKLVLELIRESPRCMQKHIVDTIGKDQGQVAKAIDRLIEVGLVVKKEGRLMAQ